MADRYWVGGTGTWGSTTPQFWSTSSGGAGGASVPTASDNVFFDAGSDAGGDFTVTMTGTRLCKDIIISGLDFQMTLTGTSQITVSGSLFFPATNFIRAASGTTSFNSTTTGNTVTTNGISLSGVTFNGIGGEWSLQDALTCGAIVVTNGSFDTISYNITCTSITSNNSSVRTISLGSSTVTMSGSVNFTDSTNLTFNAGTSSITSTADSLTIDGGGVTFNNFTRSNTNQSSPFTISGNNTFNNLTIAARASAGVSEVLLGGNQTINGTLTFSASANAARRQFIRSDTVGTTRTLNCAAFSGTDIDFRDIAGAGAAAPLSGTRFGDCKGNSGVTFDAAKTVYYRATSTANWGAGTVSSWSLTSGGTADFDAFPLAQDTAVIPATTYPASGSTITMNTGYNIGTVDLSLRTGAGSAVTFSNGTFPDIYGDFIGGTAVTYSLSGTFTFAGRNTQTITSAGRTFTQTFTIDSPSGTVLLADAFTTNRAATAAFRLTEGTLNLNDFNLTVSSSVGTMNVSGSSVRTLAIGSGTLTIAGGVSAFSAATSTNLTVTGTGTISLTRASSKTFFGGGIQTYPVINQGGVGELTINGSNKFADITNSAIGPVSFLAGATNEFGAFNLNGISGNLLTLGATTAAQTTLIKPTAWNVGANSTDAGNNTGLSFTAGGNDYLNISYINGEVVIPPILSNSNMFLMFN